ncbi:PilT/PilU family type 4a pilus ATPase [Candidatus Methylobacter oryzae]|uniref:PilT/PilU family type 4a pilus ATPase n=1 Tax=Candidatus Methylobacter oryzae TaxID=2497749 RepID=A0ABY3CDH9_9GAMM|nr:PilT/PilU family type 4a pilus ATPase [Candidatus Methylobacter oryzae]TRX00502.1 PilT/PilU family type 4a pilus ATPase [Candidatus Methylobacter oryzae]
MTLTPYLKLMLEKKADSLSLKAGSPALLGLAGEEYPLGKNELTSNVIKEITFSLINDAQKQELVQNRALKFDCSAPDGEKFLADVKVEDNGLVLFIVPESVLAKNKTAEQPAESYRILGEAPEDDLNILPYLHEMIKLDASDLFLTVGSPVKAKIYGRAVPLDDFLLTPELTQSGAFGIMNQQQIDEFLVTRDLDFAISLPDGSARFRANAFYQRKTVGLVLRLIPSKIPTGQELGTPDILMELIMSKRGLLLMVGGTGSGKSTTLAAMINHRNANSAGHILTIEDPVEFSHPNLKSIVNQREVGVDTDSYARALKASLREAPDVILIGEIRDRETMSAALELANTGHLCISTMHSNNANQAMERVINMYPREYHAQLFMDLAVNLNAVISQRLIPDTSGKRCAAIEVMINTPHIANLILKGDLHEIKDAMKSSGSKGMRTFDDALYLLYKDGRISLEEALKNADSSNDLEARINFG